MKGHDRTKSSNLKTPDKPTPHLRTKNTHKENQARMTKARITALSRITTRVSSSTHLSTTSILLRIMNEIPLNLLIPSLEIYLSLSYLLPLVPQY